MDIHYLYLVVAALQGWVTASGFRRCTYSKELKMMGANCYELNFEEIPKTLNKDIEFLYMGKNRIRTLTNSSLQEYTSLRYLYLGDNFIQKIETGAFSELEDLEVLDLSRNALISLPTDLPLPLRKLYLADNQFLRNLSLSAAFNLNFLNIAKCDLKKIPAIGMLPNLQVLNVSDNPLQSVTPADLAPLCRLEVLHLPPSLYSQMDDETLCQCHRLLTWTTQRYIKLPAFNCTPLRDPDAAGCDTDLSEEIKMYKSCLVATPATTTRHLLLAVLAGALLLAVVVIVCWWRKGRTKKNSVQDQKRTDKNTKVADTLIT
ncbi:decorin [Homalodisca vitripennis]|uniref:LRRCT domain-containing protein n=1 Tax=Homalodisca liturata TaxID=320908 RepID=A0A1B6K5E4_9HEMI|nr:decorin [Homalodisca vitripennis]